jgi:phospholipase/carboxylesterase
VLDPRRRLLIVTPRAPLSLPGWPGYHWYVVPEVGYPNRETFEASVALLAELHDELWRRTGIAPERTILGGFSMGSVMSYALALDPGRPAPAGIMALSGFVPTVDGWQADFAGRAGLRAFIAHGRRDLTISVSLARSARALLEAGGIEVEYHETEAGHQVDPAYLIAATAWLERTGGLSPPAG